MTKVLRQKCLFHYFLKSTKLIKWPGQIITTQQNNQYPGR